MATQTYVNGVTLSDASEFSRFDTAAYPVLTGVGGTANAITATGPANFSYTSPYQPVLLIPGSTNTGSTAIVITPSGGSALASKNIFSGGSACVGGELGLGVPTWLLYDGTQLNIIGNAITRGSTSTTFTFDGGGATTGAITLTWQKIGQFVRLNIPIVTGASGTGSTFLQSDTALAAAVRPASTQNHVVGVAHNNGADLASPARIGIETSGKVTIYRDGVGTTAYTNSSTCGLNVNVSLDYFIG